METLEPHFAAEPAAASEPTDAPAEGAEGADDQELDDEQSEELIVFWEAVREGDKEGIEALLVGDEDHPPLGISVDAFDDEGMSAIHWLTIEGHEGVAQWLIDEVCADVNLPDRQYGQSALHHAAVKDRVTMTQVLLQRDADPMAVDASGWTPLHACARAGSVDAAACLLSALSAEQVNFAGSGGQTALHRAAFWGHLPMVELLLQHGADREKADDSGRTPLAVIGEGGAGGATLPGMAKVHAAPPRPAAAPRRRAPPPRPAAPAWPPLRSPGPDVACASTATDAAAADVRRGRLTLPHTPRRT